MEGKLKLSNLIKDATWFLRILSSKNLREKSKSFKSFINSSKVLFNKFGLPFIGMIQTMVKV